jgi:hypothetical protein
MKSRAAKNSLLEKQCIDFILRVTQGELVSKFLVEKKAAILVSNIRPIENAPKFYFKLLSVSIFLVSKIPSGVCARYRIYR